MRRQSMTTLLLGSLALLWALGAWAQTRTPPTPQFAFTGFIQEAMLDTTGKICTPPPQSVPILGGGSTPLDVSRLRGGMITVNGIKMIVPCNTILQMPAATFTFADLFDPANSRALGPYIGALQNPVPANPVAVDKKTGLALADTPMPFPSFDVSVVGNVVGKYDADIDVNGDGVPELPAGTDKYIVALIAPIEQQVLNGGSGIVSFIDYVSGSFRAGGKLDDPNCTQGGEPGGGPNCSGSLLQFNDPEGRWGLPHSIDPRFSGDNENVTIHASTGIPVCIPRVAPPGTSPLQTGIDPLCPVTNRPLNGDLGFPLDPFLALDAPLKIFQMPAPVLDANGVNTVTPDAYQQVPIMVGDQVNWIGTVYQINPRATIPAGCTLGVDPGCIRDNTAANTYMSVHTVEDVLGIFTAPGVPPAYVTIEGMLIGTGGAAIQGLLQEASTRLTVVGFTTDPTRLIDISAQDINPCTGEETLRRLATTDPSTQPLVGRFVHRVLGGNFMPPTRYYVMKSRTQFLDPTTGLPRDPQPLVANGILPGQYLLPNFEYVIPENHRLGDPIIPGNFQDIPFLAQGSGPLDGNGAVVGQLDPWPGKPTPPKVNCSNFGHAPIVNAGSDLAAGVGTTVRLSGAVIWDPHGTGRTVQWTQVDPVTLNPIPPTVILANRSALVTTFTAPSTPQTLTFLLTATDSFGPGTDTVNVVVLPTADTVQVTVGLWSLQRGKRGPFGKLTVTATSSDPLAILSLTQISVDGTVIDWGTGAADPLIPGTFNWVENKGALQPSSLTVTSSAGGSATVTCTPVPLRNRANCP